MGIMVTWDDDDQTVIRMKFEGQWNLEELRAAGIQVVVMIRSVTHPVYVISEIRPSSVLPPGVLWQMRDINRLRPPNWSGGIALTDSTIAKQLIDTLGEVYMTQPQRERLFVVETEAEASEIIAKLKESDQSV